MIDTDLSGKVLDVVLRNSASAVLQRRTYDYVVGSDQRALVQLMVDQAGNRTRYSYVGGDQFPYGEIPSIVWECSPVGFIPNPFG